MLKNKFQRFIILLLLTSIGLSTNNIWAQSNEGVDFWLGFMEHIDVGQNTKVVMVTSKYNTSGVVSIPHHDWSQNFSVQANDVVLINLPAYTENIGSEIIDDIGVRVTSLDPVSVYIHQYSNFRSEATTVLPVSSIGRQYFVLTYRGTVFNGIHYPSEFLIVATQDETNIDIAISDDSDAGLPAGTLFSIQLDKGETYQVQANSGFGDMTGSFISSDKNIALFAGNNWTAVPANCGFRDNLLEQMLPVSTWGKKFVTVPNDKVSHDIFRILASEDNTTVEVFGNQNLSYVINAGEYKEYQRSDPTFIDSDKPIQVAQFNVGSQCSGYSLGDPSMVLLNSIEQTRDTVTLYNSSFQNITENFINIIFATDDFDFIMFDGQALPGNVETGTVGLNDEFSFARLQVNSGAHTIISDGCGVIATAYGYGDLESYAYSGGASFKSINFNPIPEGGCLNDTISFDTGLPENRYSFFWDLGDGTTTTEAVFDHFYSNLGTYPVQLILSDACLGTVDTFNRDLLISLRQAVEALGDTMVCEGESINLMANDLASASFEWTGPNGFFSDEQFPTINNATPPFSGQYSVVGIISGCATFPAFVDVGIVPIPTPNLGPDTIFCNIEIDKILAPGDYASYLWQNNSDNSFLNVQGDGTYWVEVVDQYGCIGSDTVTLRKICPTEVYVPNVFSPNFDGTNDYFKVYGHDIITMRLRVFNRWGDFIFESNSQDERWDGTYKGKDVQEGVYAWQLEITGALENGSLYSSVLSGSVTVVR